jgi:hypothetical protein
MPNKTPIEHYLHDVSLVNAMTEFVFHLDDYGHRFDPDFHVKLNKRRAQVRPHINFKDPAILALFDILGMDVDGVPAPADFKTVFKHEADYQDNPNHHSKLSAIKALVAMRKDNGWADLDKMLTLSHGIPLSLFFDDIMIHHHLEDTGPVGEYCYRIHVVQDGTANNGYDLSFAHPWFAVATDFEHALGLVRMIMEGDLRVPVTKTTYAPLSIRQIALFKGTMVLDIAVQKNEPLAGTNQAFPLLGDGKRSYIYGGLPLIQDLAKFAPTLEFKNLRQAKGLALEESLGL